MENAKEELIAAVKDRKVLCAEIWQGSEYDDDRKCFRLGVNHSANEFDLFLSLLDFNYDDGYGGQEVFGTVWLDNGEWLERGEYDGSEWWKLRSYPEIPECLK